MARSPLPQARQPSSPPATPRKARTGPRAAPASAPSAAIQDDGLRTRILRTAVLEFAEHSYGGARIDRISKAAGTVDRMLYYYFGNKQQLYQSALEQVYQSLIDAQQESLAQCTDPLEGIRTLVRETCMYYRCHPEFVRLLMTENLLRAQTLKQSQRLRGTLVPMVQRMQQWVEQGQGMGLFHPQAQARLALLSLMSLGFFYVANQHTTALWLEEPGTDEEARFLAWVAHVQAMVLDYLRTGPDGATPKS